jgi:hypothetical protein
MSLKNIKPSAFPFWSWNGKLKKEKLFEQIDLMKTHGYGGFFMHARSGLQTEYLSDEWFECINACCDYAKEKGMQAWAYDENGWPSGFVGGKLVDIKEFRHRYLTSAKGKFDENATREVFLACLIYIVGQQTNVIRDLLYKYFFAK